MTQASYINGTIASRFWAKVDVKGAEDCWPFLGFRNGHGYGVMLAGQKNRKAHRLAWELANDQPLGDRLACHHCDNPSCCNPKHLYPGTVETNMADRSARGRTNKGEGVAHSVVTEEIVRKIRSAKGKIKQVELAKMYGLKGPHVSDIMTRRIWKHVGDAE